MEFKGNERSSEGNLEEIFKKSLQIFENQRNLRKSEGMQRTAENLLWLEAGWKLTGGWVARSGPTCGWSSGGSSSLGDLRLE